MKSICGIALAVVLVSTLSAAPRPNLLVVMVDDLGFSDLGCYGSEIATPNLDDLARNGLRFSQFYNTAKCHSSRISLLTGRYAYQAGNLDLSRATTSAEVLRKDGYFTAMTGKWHLKEQPTDFGFDRYFGHLSGACNYYRGDRTFRLNGEPWAVPDKGFYTTVANVDFALQFLKEARTTRKPWHLYVAFNAPHAPLQPLKEDYEKYLGSYDVGWDVARDHRLAKQRELGLFGKDVKPSPRPDHIPAWTDLSADRRSWESRRMTALAGMIDRVDQELGRLFRDLKAAGEWENTMILFVSDNGACPYDRRSNGRDRQPYEPEVAWGDSTGWAWARNAPFRLYKQNQFEGGIATPAIVHWPAGLRRKPGSIAHTPAHLVDVQPTLAEIAGASLLDKWPGRELEPLAGVSLLPVLQGRPIERSQPLHFLFSTDRAIREDDWKLVSFRSLPWELYNLAEDRTELNDVAARHPELVSRLSRRWHEMTEHVLKAPAKSNEPVAAETAPKRHPEWTAFDLPLADTGKRDRGKRHGNARPPIRARRETKLTIRKSALHLECTGADSGIAIDHIKGVAKSGPYRLTFQLKADAGDNGELYFTTDARTKLPSGTHLEFKIEPGSEWQDFALELETTKVIYALRLDPGDRPGSAVIRNLTLRDADDRVLHTWPAK